MSRFTDSLAVLGAQKLLHWQYILLLDRTRFSPHEAFILDRWHQWKAPSIDQSDFFYSILKDREGLLKNLLIHIFYFEALYSSPGRLFLEHSKIVKDYLPPEVQISFTPQFSRPLACIICKKAFKDLNKSNWKSKFPKVKCTDCANDWESAVERFDEALAACLKRLRFKDGVHTSEDVLIFKSLLEGLGLLKHCQFEPRYHLSDGYKKNPKEWTHIEGIVTEESYHPMFERALVGCWVSGFYRMVQYPSDDARRKEACDIDGKPINTNNEPILLEELKDYIDPKY